MTCKYCNGDGWVQNAYGKEWSRIFKELMDSGVDILTANMQSIKIMDKEYPEWRDVGVEDVCDQCNGTGVA